jgi:hypothetical protein
MNGRNFEMYEKASGSKYTTLTIAPDRITVKLGSQSDPIDVSRWALRCAEMIPTTSPTLRGRIHSGHIILWDCNRSYTTFDVGY